MLIKKTEAARILGISKQAVQKLHEKEPIPDFFVVHKNRYWVDDSKQSWIDIVDKYKNRPTKEINTEQSVMKTVTGQVKRGATTEKKKKINN